MITLAPKITLDRIQEYTIRTLLYFDIFQYPLKKDEILQFLGTSANQAVVEQALDALAQQQVIYRRGEFYGIPSEGDPVTRRVRGNVQAVEAFRLAQAKARIIGSFPFVRAVLASGSLSKGYMDEKSDLDFFIVTEPNRLWIARTLLIMYMKIFLPPARYKEFCINYFISLDRLEIEEKNIYTATELATLCPLYHKENCALLMDANPWARSFLPYYVPRNDQYVVKAHSEGIKRIAELLLDIFFGGWVDLFLMKLTWMRTKKRYSKLFTTDDFMIAFKTKRYVSKMHLHHYQKKVMDLFNQRLESFRIKHALRETG